MKSRLNSEINSSIPHSRTSSQSRNSDSYIVDQIHPNITFNSRLLSHTTLLPLTLGQIPQCCRGIAHPRLEVAQTCYLGVVDGHGAGITRSPTPFFPDGWGSRIWCRRWGRDRACRAPRSRIAGDGERRSSAAAVEVDWSSIDELYGGIWGALPGGIDLSTPGCSWPRKKQGSCLTSWLSSSSSLDLELNL